MEGEPSALFGLYGRPGLAGGGHAAPKHLAQLGHALDQVGVAGSQLGVAKVVHVIFKTHPHMAAEFDGQGPQTQAMATAFGKPPL